MKIKIIGDGQFGSFLKKLLDGVFEISDDAEVLVLAVPISAYDEVGRSHMNKRFVNMCSVQQNSHDILKNYSYDVLSVHPLFGPRTPEDKRNSIITFQGNSEWEQEFLDIFSNVSKLIYGIGASEHDKMMAKTHLLTIEVYEQIKDKVLEANNIPDEFITQSFRLLKDFINMIDGMSEGTKESIKSNIYK